MARKKAKKRKQPEYVKKDNENTRHRKEVERQIELIIPIVEAAPFITPAQLRRTMQLVDPTVASSWDKYKCRTRLNRAKSIIRDKGKSKLPEQTLSKKRNGLVREIRKQCPEHEDSITPWGPAQGIAMKADLLRFLLLLPDEQRIPLAQLWREPAPIVKDEEITQFLHHNHLAEYVPEFAK